MREDTPNTDDESTTTSTMERWEYIGTILAGLMVASFTQLNRKTFIGGSTIYIQWVTNKIGWSHYGGAWFRRLGNLFLS